MAGLAVLLIIIAFAAYQYFKGTVVKAFALIVITLCAFVVAFAYFEVLINTFADRIDLNNSPVLALWVQPLCFILLFVIVFAILRAIASKLIRQQVSLSLTAERVGRVVCGIFLGLISSGLLLTILAMAPLSNKYPYQRFNQSRPNFEKPNRLLFNADGFVTGWFSLLSKGSLSGNKSFAVFHPRFLDQVFLNRHNIDDQISPSIKPDVLEVPNKEAAWPAPEGLTDLDGQPIAAKAGHHLLFVRVGISKKVLKKNFLFTPAQLRLICKHKSNMKKRFAGKAKNIYPLGYLQKPNRLQTKALSEEIELQHPDFEGRVKWIDFAFYVPNEWVPVIVEFRQNNLVIVPAPVTADKAPPAIPFSPSSPEDQNDTN